jgi:monoamine oxidase
MLLLWKNRTFYKGMPKEETRPGGRTTTVSNGGSPSRTGRQYKEVFKLQGISTKQTYKQGFNISDRTKEQRHGNHIKDQ